MHKLGMVMHAFNSSSQEGGGNLCEFEANLVT